jgi:hypothetical protein
MSRHNNPSSRGHRVKFVPDWGGYYFLSWTVDRYYPGSRLRHPSSHTRETDRKGAERFAKKWKIEIENDPQKITSNRAEVSR